MIELLLQSAYIITGIFIKISNLIKQLIYFILANKRCSNQIKCQKIKSQIQLEAVKQLCVEKGCQCNTCRCKGYKYKNIVGQSQSLYIIDHPQLLKILELERNRREQIYYKRKHQCKLEISSLRKQINYNLDVVEELIEQLSNEIKGNDQIIPIHNKLIKKNELNKDELFEIEQQLSELIFERIDENGSQLLKFREDIIYAFDNVEDSHQQKDIDQLVDFAELAISSVSKKVYLYEEDQIIRYNQIWQNVLAQNKQNIKYDEDLMQLKVQEQGDVRKQEEQLI